MGSLRTMPFRCEIPVRFADCDVARIVYYPRFLHFCHVTMEEFFHRRVGVPYHLLLEKEDVGYPTVRVEIEYQKPVPMGEILDMAMDVERLGRRSVDFVYTGRRQSDGLVAFVAKCRSVATSMARWESRDMPPRHREVFQAMLQEHEAASEGAD